jgi:hypothetical protein
MSFFPAAEVVEKEGIISKSSVTLSPTLSPSFSDEDSINSPNTIVNHDFQLGDFFAWDAQQLLLATTL